MIFRYRTKVIDYRELDRQMDQLKKMQHIKIKAGRELLY